MVFRNNPRFGRSIGIDDSSDAILLLMDEIKSPCLLINSINQKIICANLSFIELTGYGNHDLKNEPIKNIILGIDDDIEDKKGIVGTIINKSGKRISTSCSKKVISANKNYFLLKFSLDFQTEENEIILEINDTLVKLIVENFSDNPLNFIESFLHETRNLFKFQECVLYISDDKMLARQNFSATFPDELPLMEYDRIQKLDFWYQSKRILCETHRIARKNSFSGVITSRLEFSEKKSLFVAVIDNWKKFEYIEKQFKLFINWINIISNITTKYKELKKNLQWIKNKNSLFNNLIENSNDAIVVVNERNEIELINNTFLRLLDYSSFEVMNKDIHDLIQNEKIETALKSLEKNEKRKVSKVLIHNRAGNDIFIDVLIINEIVGELTKKILILKNITREYKLSNSFKRIENQAALGESIADFAHDVRNPLNNISTGLQMLRKVFNDNQMIVDTVDRTQSDCIRMSDLIESVLSFSRQNVTQFDILDLSEIVDNVIRHFENTLRKANINYAVTKNIDEAKIIGDYRSIERVLINLVNNSVQAMESRGGELSLILDKNSKNKNEYLISIADTGVGIPKEMQNDIFEPYVTGKKTGTGLGLSITKRIIEAHKGRIELESYTNGTIFRLFFIKVLEETN